MLQFLSIEPDQIDLLTKLALRFAFNLASTFIIVVLLYARISKRKEFYFSYFAISIAVFLLVFLLESVKVELGFALGLFAIFGIIRYRTDAIPPKEMTYLFIIIAVSVINALSKDYFSYIELTFVNLLLVGALWALEKILMMRQENSMLVVYEKIENLHSDRENELIADLEERTGVKVKRYQIENIDFLRDTARITLFFENNGRSKREIN
ncbi:protein of unknown function [Tangfeifania diversioriginum]|uniref:DUF4956 domain-containing protein n=1 Tax=Tangfeifania diversioriginum TaxID=1168035 RepID=A0A1M6BGU9_9BACT|nr:DUF4956 domain-containing protein [Tangfeifania diversioriginum]SHI48000.1 protein of unknown function [Tangfeifania diversioriginum]